MHASVKAGQLFLIAAPSGGGKSSLVGALLAQDANIKLSISCTTRPARPGEQTGREYHFLSVTDFMQRRDRGEFVESAEVHGNFYGTSRVFIEQQLREGNDVLLEIDWQGARQIRGLFPELVDIFILPPSLEVLKERLEKRGQDSETVIATRLAGAEDEIGHASEFEYVIINQQFPIALQDLTAIINVARLRFRSQAARHGELFSRLGINL